MWGFGKYLFDFLVSEDEVFIIIYIRNFYREFRKISLDVDIIFID